MQNHTFNILIIEDATIVIQQLYLLLSNKSASYNIQTANSAELGLQLVTQEFPDVFIIDIKLPGMSGIEFMNRIKQEYPAANSLIIFLTNMPHDTYKQACMNNGANYFLDKSKEFLMLPEIIENFFLSKKNNKVIPNPTISILCNTPT
jgi:CheY-like chemotaxis protein